MSKWFSTGLLRPYNGERIGSLTKSGGENGYPHAQELNCILTLQHSNLTQNGLDLNIRAKTIKVLQENMGVASGHWIRQQFLKSDTKTTDDNKSKNRQRQ